MRRTDTAPAGAPAGEDPLGGAARLRLARLDAEVMPERLLHVGVDAVVLALVLALPALVAAVASLLVTVPVVVPTLAGAAAVAVCLVAALVTWPHHDGGRTAGMRWAGLRLVDGRGGPPARKALALRALLLPADLVVGLPMVLIRADHRRLGDLVAGTQVVRDLSAAAGPARRPGAATIPRAAWPTARPAPRR